MCKENDSSGLDTHSEQIIERNDALALGLKYYFTGRPCKRGHIARRFVSVYKCIECARVESLNSYRKDPIEAARRQREGLNKNPARRENSREAARQWKKENAIQNANILKQWREANKESLKLSRKEKRLLNPEEARLRDLSNRAKYREKRAENMRNWRQKNKIKVYTYQGYYRAINREKDRSRSRERFEHLRLAQPPWIDFSQLEAIYKEAREISESTGIPHQVDHIIPLKGRSVCGLHVPWNLRIITRSENSRKRNTILEDAILAVNVFAVDGE